jgi:O-antigen ligase
MMALALLAVAVGLGSAQAGAQAFLPIFGVLLLAVILARPEYGVALLLSTFLMAYPRWIQGTGYLTLNNVLGGIFAVMLTYEIYRSQDWWFLRVPQVQLLLVIVVLYFLSDTLNAPDPEKVNLLGAGFYFAEGLRIFVNRVAFTLFFITFIRTPRNVRMIYMLALGFMMITALSGVQNVLAGGGLKGYRAFTGATELVAGQVGVIRAAGNPNRLAMFAVLAIGGLWYLMQSIRSLTARVVIVPLLVTLALAVFLTASRSGLVGLVLCTAVIVLDGGFDVRKIFTVILAGLLLAVVAVQFVPERNLERILNLPGTATADVGEGEASLERRQYSWTLAWELFKENPVLGVGMGNWAVVRFIRDPGRSAGSPHNSFLLALVEGGPLVLIGFLLVLWYTWRDIRVADYYVRLPDFPLAYLTWIVKATKVSLIVFMFFSAVADLFNLVLLFMLIGFAVSLRRICEQTARGEVLA